MNMFRPKFRRKHHSGEASNTAGAISKDRLHSDVPVRARHHSLPHEYDEETTQALLPDEADPSYDPREPKGGHGIAQQTQKQNEAKTGPLGLNVVYSPDKGAHKADVVFVHGLGGTSRFTWAKHKDPNLFWPLHFLSKEADVAQARILTFGYDANFRRKGSVSVSITDFAKDLLYDLKYAKDGEGHDLGIGVLSGLTSSARVADGMGGLIIKEAYIQGQNDPQYEPIVKAIVAVTFLATPHRGTNLATLLNLILTSTLFSNSKQYINELNQNSIALQKLNDQFPYQLARTVPAFLERALDVADEGLDLGTADARMVWERLFKSAILKMRDLPQPLYWIIDGVDEATDPRAVIKTLSDIQFAAANIRLLFVSRSTSEITAAFSKIPRTLNPQSIGIEAQSGDLHRYITQELDIVASEEVRSEVIKRLLDGAHNNFLWVRLAIRKLNSSHSEADIDAALQDLPEVMEALYDRMGASIASQSSQDQTFTKAVLQCIATSWRVLSVAELSKAIQGDTPKMLSVQKAIVDLCAAFAVVDNDGNVAMVHQTARQYLLDGGTERPFHIQGKVAHAHMFASCMSSLMTPGLRAKVQSHQKPEFLDYAAVSWSKHLVSADYSWRSVGDALAQFLSGPWILIWIHYLSETNQLGVLIDAAQNLSTYFSRRRRLRAAIDEEGPFQIDKQALLEGWTIDLVKIVGKFGTILHRHPDAIYKLIPPFCPEGSSIYQYFGKQESKNLSISGVSSDNWDDSVARLTLGPEVFAASISVAGAHIAVLASTGNAMSTFIYQSSTFEMCPASPIKHNERVQKMELNAGGTLLATYGYRKTIVWSVTSGDSLLSVDNFKTGQKALAMLITKHDTHLLVGTDDRCLRSLDLTEQSPAWQILAELDEDEIEGHHLNSPSFMAMNRDGSLVAVAYRGHPPSAWEIEGSMPLGHLWRTREEVTFGQVCDAVWNPLYPELFGLYTEGTLFKWQPYDDEKFEIPVGASKLCISSDGNLIATGDARGSLKIFATTDLSMIYQMTSEEVVFGLCLSPDIRRIYDIRGYYANAWEPSALTEFAEQRDIGMDSQSDIESIMTRSVPSSHSGRIHSITVLTASPTGQFYAYGTDQGEVFVYDLRNHNLSQVYSAKSFFSIDHLEWSETGRYLSCSHSGKKVVLMTVLPHEAEGDFPSVEVCADIRVVANGVGNFVTQLLFDQTSTRLAVFSASSIQVISLSSLIVTHTRDLHHKSCCKWILHPYDSRRVLGVMIDTLEVLDWDLGVPFDYRFKLPSPHISQSALAADHDVNNNIRIANDENLLSTAEFRAAIIDRVIVTQGRTKLVLVQMSVGQSRTRKMLFLSFDAVSLDDLTPENGSRPVIRATQFIPPGVAGDILLLLGCLSGDRLVYLSRAFAVCIWRAPAVIVATLPTRNQSHSSSSSATVTGKSTVASTFRPPVTRHISLPEGSLQPGTPPGRELSSPPIRAGVSHSRELTDLVRTQGLPSTPPARPHSTVRSTPVVATLFYLPGDWVNRDWFAPCVLWAKEVSLLCPRNGEVAMVRCTALA
nr:hypothetical protein B0A51_05045 [Rachicladosporium sp. CCFEE 5018]